MRFDKAQQEERSEEKIEYQNRFNYKNKSRRELKGELRSLEMLKKQRELEERRNKELELRNNVRFCKDSRLKLVGEIDNVKRVYSNAWPFILPAILTLLLGVGLLAPLWPTGFITVDKEFNYTDYIWAFC